jgi:hypothetical protein
MAIETLVVSALRGGQPVASLANTPVRIVEKTIMVQTGQGGAIPYTTIRLFSREGVPDIRQKDLLTVTDGTIYRTSGIPIVHDSSYLSIELVHFVETTP